MVSELRFSLIDPLRLAPREYVALTSAVNRQRPTRWLVSSLRDSVPIFSTYPGLTSGAIVCPPGLGRARLAISRFFAFFTKELEGSQRVVICFQPSPVQPPKHFCWLKTALQAAARPTRTKRKDGPPRVICGARHRAGHLLADY